jgi:hypothetical protein
LSLTGLIEAGIREGQLAAGSAREMASMFATLGERKIEALLVTADGFFFCAAG